MLKKANISHSKITGLILYLYFLPSHLKKEKKMEAIGQFKRLVPRNFQI